jgi:hypothetical protein
MFFGGGSFFPAVPQLLANPTEKRFLFEGTKLSII